MRRAEQLHEEILAQMDLSKEASDEELLELIHRILEENRKKSSFRLEKRQFSGESFLTRSGSWISCRS